MRPIEGAGPASRATVAARLLVVPRVGSFENAARSFTGGTPHPRLDTDRETDSEQVPRGKVEKHSEKRVKENAKPSEVAPEQACGRVCVRPRLVVAPFTGAPRRTPVEESRDRPDSDRSRADREAAIALPTLGLARARRPVPRRFELGPRIPGVHKHAGVSDPVDLAPTTRLETRTEESDACASRWLAERKSESRNAQRRQTKQRPGNRPIERRALPPHRE